jgi:hypothetical protein
MAMLAPEWEKSATDNLERLEVLFAGRHFDREVLPLCVGWYLRSKLSPRDLVEMTGSPHDLSKIVGAGCGGADTSDWPRPVCSM